MGYYNRRTATRAPLTPPAELVGQVVTWRPKHPDGKRGAPVLGRVRAHDAAGRTLTIEVQQPVSPWQPNPTRTVVVPLSSGPFVPRVAR